MRTRRSPTPADGPAVVPRRPPRAPKAPKAAPVRRYMRINGGPPGRPAAVRRAFAGKAQTVVRKQQRALRNAAVRQCERRGRGCEVRVGGMARPRTAATSANVSREGAGRGSLVKAASGGAESPAR